MYKCTPPSSSDIMNDTRTPPTSPTMAETQLPTGYRFYPTEEELIAFYLHNKLQGSRQDMEQVIPVINIYNMEPCQLPQVSGNWCKRDTEQWFFFVPRQQREAHGGRPARTTATGYWKATGSPCYVYSSNSKVIGLKKTMVFYKGKAPVGRKTKWKMNEYRAIQEVTEAAFNQQSNPDVPQFRSEFTLCRVYVVSANFQAFDRRPVEGQLGPSAGTVPISAPAECPQSTASSSWEINAAHLQQQQPLWDWELADWP